MLIHFEFPWTINMIMKYPHNAIIRVLNCSPCHYTKVMACDMKPTKLPAVVFCFYPMWNIVVCLRKALVDHSLFIDKKYICIIFIKKSTQVEPKKKSKYFSYVSKYVVLNLMLSNLSDFWVSLGCVEIIRSFFFSLWLNCWYFPNQKRIDINLSSISGHVNSVNAS